VINSGIAFGMAIENSIPMGVDCCSSSYVDKGVRRAAYKYSTAVYYEVPRLYAIVKVLPKKTVLPISAFTAQPYVVSLRETPPSQCRIPMVCRRSI
jgi:hypothetical protein